MTSHLPPSKDYRRLVYLIHAYILYECYQLSLHFFLWFVLLVLCCVSLFWALSYQKLGISLPLSICKIRFDAGFFLLIDVAQDHDVTLNKHLPVIFHDQLSKDQYRLLKIQSLCYH